MRQLLYHHTAAEFVTILATFLTINFAVTALMAEAEIYSIPDRMKIYTDFNLANWLKLINFTKFNISEF